MSSHATHVMVKCYGNVYKVQKAPHETDERAYDRAWYIARQLRTHTGSWDEKVCLSHAWANHVYFGMEYNHM